MKENDLTTSPYKSIKATTLIASHMQKLPTAVPRKGEIKTIQHSISKVDRVIAGAATMQSLH